jgi:hypothetical protein
MSSYFSNGVKQHLHIKSFYGTSENAVYAQIWISGGCFFWIFVAFLPDFQGEIID